MTDKQQLASLADIADYFGAFKPTNESLSRRVYKDTECGAWAKVITRTKVDGKVENWQVRYARVDGVWTVIDCNCTGIARNWSDVPAEVRAYFWPNAEEVNTYLSETCPSAVEHTESAHILVKYIDGEENVFIVGSIAEGTDAEFARQLVLPATPQEVDDAIKDVEMWANDVRTAAQSVN
ncbi:hypothetical protein UFOVP75_32 [uncultured Caudovirales phage]|uniref:Uncharacterized protein n=1 Tax=uncultured Caudovirales phage TaxID=2100421 RepID=A0A6J5KXM1_9CAUD|nr:hypothetical protein UFOVP75_32 [uncultured Caudovirales phage]